jgi:hypothetical protein
MENPAKLSNATVYLDNDIILGVADVELPTIEYDSESLNGLGIGGEIELPNPAAVQAMSATLNFKTVTPRFAVLSAPKPHTISLLGAMQWHNPYDKTNRFVQVRAFMIATPKSSNSGKSEQGQPMESSIEFSVQVYKLEIDGSVYMEVDPENFKLVIDGEDYLSDIRAAMGR